MTQWLNLRHEESGGTTRIPNSPDVLAVHEAKGWRLTPESEAEMPFAPALAVDEVDVEWVELIHPDIPTGVNRVPNNPAAIQGAMDAGWLPPALTERTTSEADAVSPPPKTPAPDAGTEDEPAGDGANEE